MPENMACLYFGFSCHFEEMDSVEMFSAGVVALLMRAQEHSG
jgi:hypothetical protein